MGLQAGDTGSASHQTFVLHEGSRYLETPGGTVPHFPGGCLMPWQTCPWRSGEGRTPHILRCSNICRPAKGGWPGASITMITCRFMYRPCTGFVTSFQSHVHPMRISPLYTGKGPKAQSSQVTCPGSHSPGVGNPRPEPVPSDSEACIPLCRQ